VFLDRINALPVDEDVSLLSASIIDHPIREDAPDQLVLADLPPPKSQSMVPNLDITTTERDLIVQEITDRKLPLPVCPRRRFA
jgi:hypothetical protein